MTDRESGEARKRVLARLGLQWRSSPHGHGLNFAGQ
jgi:hypothetical protein